MKKKRFSVEQIVGVLKQAEVEVPIGELVQQVGISEQTFYRWKKRYGGIVKLRLTAVSDAQYGGFTTGLSRISWGSIDQIFVNLTMPCEFNSSFSLSTDVARHPHKSVHASELVVVLDRDAAAIAIQHFGIIGFYSAPLCFRSLSRFLLPGPLLSLGSLSSLFLLPCPLLSSFIIPFDYARVFRIPRPAQPRRAAAVRGAQQRQPFTRSGNFLVPGLDLLRRR